LWVPSLLLCWDNKVPFGNNILLQITSMSASFEYLRELPNIVFKKKEEKDAGIS
jgi:hypothetical protein